MRHIANCPLLRRKWAVFLTGERCESLLSAALFSAANSSILIMSWRGTKPHKIEDLIADLDCAQSTARELCEAGGVHSGFWKRATDTISIAKLRSMLLRDKVAKLLLCGHSLGGAVALLNAARLVRSLDLLKGSSKLACLEKIRCITFGAPQVADERAARAIESMLPNDAILNFVHLRDSETLCHMLPLTSTTRTPCRFHPGTPQTRDKTWTEFYLVFLASTLAPTAHVQDPSP